MAIPFRIPQHMKYHNKKVELDGIVFDSKKESKIYLDLKLMQQAGDIEKFERQVRFELVPAQYEFVPYTDKKGRTTAKTKCVEKAVDYVADFVVYHNDGTKAVVDVKGMRDAKYIIKRKLMRYVHHIVIQEV